MPDTKTRARFVELDLERGQIDPETGEFPMILATDGEASDGDILSIEGAQFAARAPLQLSHQNDPRSTAGTVSGFRRDLQSTPKKLRARGQIELGGEGVSAEIRRDLAHMIAQGHVTGVSVRWEPIKFQARTSLPKEHPAHVKVDESSFIKRNGLYHEKWRVLEGSIVAVQADQAAMIGRAETLETADAESAVAKFWRALAADATSSEAPEAESVAAGAAVATPPVAAGSVTPEAQLAAFAAQIREFKAAGLPIEALAAEVEREMPPKEPTPAELVATLASQAQEIAAMREKLASLEGRVQGAPVPPLRSVKAMYESFDQRMQKTEERALAVIQAAVDARRGKVTPDQSYRQSLNAEVNALLRELRPSKSDGSKSAVSALLGALDARLDQADAHALDAVRAASKVMELSGLLQKFESKIAGAREKKNQSPQPPQENANE